jgi:hypothetical protein
MKSNDTGKTASDLIPLLDKKYQRAKRKADKKLWFETISRINAELSKKLDQTGTLNPKSIFQQ